MATHYKVEARWTKFTTSSSHKSLLTDVYVYVGLVPNTMEESILHEMNQLHKNVEFKQILQEKNCVNLWDLKNIRHNN